MRGQQLPWQKDPAKGLPHAFPSIAEKGTTPCREAPKTLGTMMVSVSPH